MAAPDRLLRVTAVAGGRRSDLAVPGGVAVAELVPDLARAVGLLDPAAVYAGYRLHAHGRRLRPDQGLSEQGVEDGALLAVAAGADALAPTVHDDLAEAVADTVQRQRAWEPADTRRTTLAAGLLALAVGLGALGWCLLPPIPTGWATPTAVLLTLVVLAGNAVPAVAISLGAARADGIPVDHDQVAASVVRSARLHLAGSAAVGTVALAALPVVAVDAVGAMLTADCCLVLLLRARRLRSRRQVLVDTVTALAGLLVTILALLAREPDSRTALAVALALLGAGLCALSRLPAAPAVLRARVLDLLETLALVALAPLLLLATDGLARVTGV
jgi:hypothetical protein